MNRLAIAAVLLGGALAAGGSTAQETAQTREQQEIAKSLAGLTAGKPQDCINPSLVTSTRTFSNVIVYVQGRDRKWVNTTNGGCEGLGNDDIIVRRSPIRQYCSGDIIETHSRGGGFFTGACSLGEFVPYTRTTEAK